MKGQISHLASRAMLLLPVLALTILQGCQGNGFCIDTEALTICAESGEVGRIDVQAGYDVGMSIHPLRAEKGEECVSLVHPPASYVVDASGEIFSAEAKLLPRTHYRISHSRGGHAGMAVAEFETDSLGQVVGELGFSCR